MEIVSRPDMRAVRNEAVAYFKKLRTILIYLGTCDGDMEKGNMRADVNVSVRRPNGELGTRCEIKNVNSFRFMQQAIEYEARRQIEILEDGGKILQETRLFDPTKGETRSMRSKEEAHDYRYFPDPDLLPLVIEEAWIEDIRRSLPELPDEKRRRFISQYGLTAYDSGVLIAEQARADFFEQSRAAGRDAETRRQLDHQRPAGPPLQGRQGHRRKSPGPGRHRRTGRADQGRRDLVEDRQGGVYDRMWSGRGRAARGVEKHEQAWCRSPTPAPSKRPSTTSSPPIRTRRPQ